MYKDQFLDPADQPGVFLRGESPCLLLTYLS
jgi:hypothetical protein